VKVSSTIFAGLFCMATSVACMGQTPTAPPLPLADGSFKLTPEQIKEDEIKALDGSPEAANKLANYYNAWANDSDKAMEWFQIAAENGSTEAMWNFCSVSEALGDAALARRGRFWLKRAADLGYKPAIEKLQRDDAKKAAGRK